LHGAEETIKELRQTKSGFFVAFSTIGFGVQSEA